MRFHFASVCLVAVVVCMAVSPPSRAQELDPIVTGRPLSDDLIGAVRRGITHDENCELLAGVVLPEKEAELAFDQRRLVRRRHHARHCR